MCRKNESTTWRHETASLDTAVICHQSNGEPLQSEPWNSTQNISYGIGEAGSELVAKMAVSSVSNASEIQLTVHHSLIPAPLRKRMKMLRIRELSRLGSQSKQVHVHSK